MESLLRTTLDRVIGEGSLAVTSAAGRRFIIGQKADPPLAMRFTCPAAQRRVLFDPELHLGEAYVDGTLVMERGSIADLLHLLLSRNATARLSGPIGLIVNLRAAWRRRHQRNDRARAQRNVAHHYDLDGALYELFLDSDRQYSCAYFEHDGQSLDAAQLAKKRHIAAKLLVEPGDSVLDIGCGWGGLAHYLAQICQARALGVTLSQEQLAYARARRLGNERAGALEFALQDYRDIEGRFDRIVSVGMFEHVGLRHYDAFFAKCRALLDENGVMLLHSIGRPDPPGYTNPWIARHIFPGGYIPSLSEVFPAIERAGLLVTDIELLRLHYADTLKHWRERFLARREQAAALYDARFVRLWEFYLAASEAAFRDQAMMVFQLQIARRQGVVPRTRDYIAVEKARLRTAEAEGAEPRASNAQTQEDHASRRSLAVGHGGVT